MSKYDGFQARQQKQTREIHPIWRGIGFAMVILIPIISILGALLLVQENASQNWFPMPYDLLAKANDPLVNLVYFLNLNTVISQPQTIYIVAILAFALIVFLSAIFTLFTFIILRIFGQSRYGPYDVPDLKFKQRRKLY
jgi:hypothetical protein